MTNKVTRKDVKREIERESYIRVLHEFAGSVGTNSLVRLFK